MAWQQVQAHWLPFGTYIKTGCPIVPGPCCRDQRAAETQAGPLTLIETMDSLRVQAPA